MRPRTLGGTAMLLAVWLLATASLRPLMLPDEGRYAGVALEMLRSGDWLVPTLDGLPYFHKPPLFYWITAGALALFGPHAIVARAAPIAGALAMLVGTAWFARRWMSAAEAERVPWLLATMPLTYLGAQYANLDMLVAGCISVAVFAFADALLRPTDARTGAVVAVGWAAMAAGVLAKGLIGIVLPLAIVVLWLALRSDRAQMLGLAARRLLHAPSIALFAALTLPWFIAVQRRYPAFVDYFLVQHHLQRFAGGGFNNEQPFWFYLPVLALLTLPWCLLWRPSRGDAGLGAPARALRLLGWAWIALIVLFFSLPRSKLVGYVLPALPPVALLVVTSIDRCNGVSEVVARWVGALAALLCVAAVLAVARYDAHRGNAALAAALDARADRGAVVYAYDTQPYDLAFHLHDARPLKLVAAWDDPTLATRDDWRRELLDAARFAPQRAADVLLTPALAKARWCSEPVSWVIAALDAGRREPALRAGAPLSATARLGLWRLEAAQLERDGACR